MRTKFLFLVAFCLMAVTTAFGQGRSIQGQVVASNDSEPLVGVEVVEKGTGNGTVTDANGRFSLTPRGNNPTLQFSYVGFLTQQVKVGNKNNLSVPNCKTISFCKQGSDTLSFPRRSSPVRRAVLEGLDGGNTL